MNQGEKVFGALVDFVGRDVSEIRELAARLLARLATHGVLGRLAIFDPTTG
jgi:hypothetical protein